MEETLKDRVVVKFDGFKEASWQGTKPSSSDAGCSYAGPQVGGTEQRRASKRGLTRSRSRTARESVRGLNGAPRLARSRTHGLVDDGQFVNRECLGITGADQRVEPPEKCSVDQGRCLFGAAKARIRQNMVDGRDEYPCKSRRVIRARNRVLARAASKMTVDSRYRLRIADGA